MVLDDWGSGWNAGEAERLLDDVTRAFAGRRVTPFLGRSEPAVNVWLNDDALVVTCEIPGVDPRHLGITVMGDILTVRGHRRRADRPTAEPGAAEPGAAEPGTAESGPDEPYEITEFSRSLQLPFRVDPDRTEARARDGLLEIALRRPESEKPRRIAIDPA